MEATIVGYIGVIYGMMETKTETTNSRLLEVPWLSRDHQRNGRG